jgi:PAS domain S-box-containing protein
MIGRFSHQRAFATLLLVAVPAILLVVFLQVQQEFRQNRELRIAFEESVAVRSGLQETLSDLQDIEVGQRGYVITGNREFLAPYDSARKRIEVRRYEAAQGSTTGQAHQIENLRDAKLAFAARAIALVEEGRGEAARALIATGEGRRLMDAIRDQIEQLDSREAARLAQLTRARYERGEQTEYVINLALGGLALLLAILSAAVWRTLSQRRAALARVRALSDRNRATFESAVDGMLVLDAEGYICEANPSITRLFGHSPESLVGMHNTRLMASPPTLEESQAWLRHVGSAGAKGSGAQQEFIGRRIDGTTLATDVSISRFFDDEELGYVAVIRDITERKRIEAMKTEFVSTVSHELRTPLTSIGGSLGLLASGAVGELNDKAARLVQIAHNNCERLIRLINDILDIEKIESGKMQFDLRRMPLGPLIARTATANRAFGADRGVEIVAEMPPWPMSVMGDPDRLEQLLTNLVSNAVKHSPDGATVCIALMARNERARIEVRDRGAGVPADFRDRIFGKFAMADGSDSRTRGGTGLGLAIAREIGERHDGTVGFSDREGGGSVFFFELPLATCEDTAEIDRDESLPLVLHIDDDRDCLLVVASAFSGRATIHSVATIEEAREAITARRFAGAIVDVVVPPDNGLDIIPALRDIAPGLPIVVFSAHDDLVAPPGVDAIMVKSRTSFDTLVETTMALVARAAREAA